MVEPSESNPGQPGPESGKTGLVRRLFGRGPSRRDVLSATVLAAAATAVASPNPHTPRPAHSG
ncbi:MAG TPA: twin-arginine translocation signal domain-containing protein, partial [Humisphaera sp.]